MDTVEVLDQKDVLFEELKQFISDIIGADIVEELDVNRESNFTRDLEMDSIEIVAFAEKVKVKYGQGLDFAGWLSAMSLEQLIDLKIGDIVDFIVDADSSDR